MEHDRDVTPDVDDTTVSVTSSLYDVQTLLNDDSDAHEDGHAVLTRGGSGDLAWARGVERGA